jgi:hypothetical protein
MSLSTWSYPFYDDNPIEKRATSRKKINQNVKKMDTDDDNLADFKPVALPQLPQEPSPPPPVQPESNLLLSEASSHQFSYPSSDRTSAGNSVANLSDRINYMIQLLEEQKDEKTGRVTEEIILYVFLGIFVIFVLDSFVKTGKYSR